jgi:hypothetical protein
MEKAKTSTGLSVTVDILDKVYQTGRKYAEGFKENMKIVFDEVACPPKAGPVLMGIVQLAESQGATHAKTTRTGPDRQDPS